MTTGRGHSEVAGTTTRSVYLDALRAVALVRVVTYHASDKWWITFATAMPLMFFIAGSLFAGSLDRRPALAVARDRYRRILLPYWAYAATMVGLWAALGVLGELTPANWVGMAFPVLTFGGPNGPGVGTPLQLTWVALWYLQLHLLFSAVGGPLRTALRRAPVVVWTAVATAFAVASAAGSGGLNGVANAVFFLGCWLLGNLYHEGRLQPGLRRHWKWVCALTGLPGAVLFLLLHDDLRVAPVASALLGVFWLVLAVGVQPWVEPLLDGWRTRAVTTWFARRSLTVYLWHMAALYAVYELTLPGSGTSVGRLAWGVALTVAVVPLVGWVEDVAARRAPEVWPGRGFRPLADAPAGRPGQRKMTGGAVDRGASNGGAPDSTGVVDLRAGDEVDLRAPDHWSTGHPAEDLGGPASGRS